MFPANAATYEIKAQLWSGAQKGGDCLSKLRRIDGRRSRPRAQIDNNGPIPAAMKVARQPNASSTKPAISNDPALPAA